jgi:hypothetical protein
MRALTNARERLIAGLALAACATVTASGNPSGLIIGEPVRVSAEDSRAIAPDIAVGADGAVHVLWVNKGAPPEPVEAGGHSHLAADELLYRRFSADLRPQGPPARVNTRDGEIWGFAVSKPELAIAADGTIHVAYPANARRKGGGSLLVARYTRSLDGGRTFERGRTLNSPAKNDLSAVMHGGFAAAHAFGTLATAGEADVHVYWIDTRNMAPQDTAGAIFAVTSRNGGKTFSADSPVYATAVCPCCQLAAVASDGNILLGSRAVSAEGFRDGAVSVSADHGRHYGERVRLGNGRWKIDGCPLKRIAIAAAGPMVFAAWYTAGEDPAGVWFSRSGDGGRTFAAPIVMHPDAAVADAPSVAAGADGQVYVAWHGKTGGDRRVFLRASMDQGVVFSPVQELPAPAGVASYPEIVAAPGGGALIAWQQEQAVYVARVSGSQPAQANVRR